MKTSTKRRTKKYEIETNAKVFNLKSENFGLNSFIKFHVYVQVYLKCFHSNPKISTFIYTQDNVIQKNIFTNLIIF
jgi:hypothetical protein